MTKAKKISIVTYVILNIALCSMGATIFNCWQSWVILFCCISCFINGYNDALESFYED